MAVDEVIKDVGAALTARRVYQEPIKQNGVTIIPAARVRGGGGGGSGEEASTEGAGEAEGAAPTIPRKRGSGGGAGFGISASPAGALVIKDGDVRFVSAVDTNLAVVAGTIVSVVALLVWRSVALAALRRRRR